MSHRMVEPRSRKELRAAAKNIRELFGLEKAIRFPICEIYEMLQYKGILQFVVLPKEDTEDEKGMGDDEGLYYPGDNVIKLREDVYEGAHQGVGRHRLTMAHEFGHWLLHTDSKVSYARNKEDVVTYRDPEWQADCFAGELLVSRDLCLNMSIEDISQECQVSRKAAAFQKKRFHK